MSVLDGKASQAPVNREPSPGRGRLLKAGCCLAASGVVLVLAVTLRNLSLNLQLFTEVTRKNAPKVEVLLQRGADPNAREIFGTHGFFGETVLMRAAQSGNVGIVSTLIKRGADVNSTYDNGTTPTCVLTYALASENPAVVDTLLKSGARTDFRARGGGTLLYEAAMFNRTEMVRLLCASGANVDAQDENGRTALAEAVDNGSVATVRVLVNAHANPDIRDSKGVSAVELAEASHNAAILDALKRQGGNR